MSWHFWHLPSCEFQTTRRFHLYNTIHNRNKVFYKPRWVDIQLMVWIWEKEILVAKLLRVYLQLECHAFVPSRWIRKPWVSQCAHDPLHHQRITYFWSLQVSGPNLQFFLGFFSKPQDLHVMAGLKVNDQLAAYATRFLAVRLQKYVRSHHRTLKAKV